MRELLSEVLELQGQWSRENTPSMGRRGRVIRTELPSLIRDILAPNREKDGLNFEVKGKDGEGNKSRIPWVRIYSSRHSPSPTVGWYCVFLFSADGKSVYLCISHGSFERPSSKELQPRMAEDLEALMVWGKKILGDEHILLGMTTAVDLGPDSKTGDQYVRSTVAGFRYEQASLPSNKQIVRDIFTVLKLLRKIYDAEDMGQMPGAETPDVAAVRAFVEDVANVGHSSGQGYGLSVQERRAVELWAMLVARRHLLELGFSIIDTSSNRPFDYEATKDGEKLIVEVKGTTGGLSSILLTHTEVAAHKGRYPRNALIVVHSIKLLNRNASPKAQGGVLYFQSPWDLALGTLEPMAFKYTLPKT